MGIGLSALDVRGECDLELSSSKRFSVTSRGSGCGVESECD